MRRLLALLTVPLLVAAGVAVSTATAPAARATASPTPGGVTATSPFRILDTRIGQGASGPVPANTTVTVPVGGVGPVPSAGVSAVLVTLTVTAPSGSGNVSAFAAGAPVPATSVVNFRAGQTVSDSALVPLGPGGALALRIGGVTTAQLIVDVTGYVAGGAPTDPGALTVIAPQRLADTRHAGGPVAGGHVLPVRVTGVGAVPGSGVGTAVLTVTAVDGSGAGYVTAYPDGSPRPATSNLNFSGTAAVANQVVIGVPSSGIVDLYVGGSGQAQLIADISGYADAGTPTSAGTIATLSPAARILDTRTGSGGSGPLPSGGSVAISPLSVTGAPDGATAALINVTATNSAGPGYVAAYPDGAVLRDASALTFGKGLTAAGQLVVPLPTDGRVLLSVSSRTDLIADVDGFVLGPATSNSAPSSVTGLTTSATKTSVSLSWTAPADPATVAVTVRRSVGTTAPTASTGTWIATLPAASTTFTDSNRTPGTQYSYSVFALDDVANLAAPASATAQATPLTWSAAADIDPYRGSPTDVSCPSTTWCMAVDQSGHALTYRSGVWSAPVAVEPAANDNGLSRVSCPSTTFCLTVDVKNQVFAYRSGAWSPVANSPAIESLSCASATFCMGGTATGAVAFNGTSWGTVHAIGQGVGLLSCASSSFCMALAGAASGVAYRWNGRSWSSGTGFFNTNGALGGDQMWVLDCVSASFCMAAGDQSYAYRYNGLHWSQVRNGLGSGNDISSLSCGSPTSCIAYANGLTNYAGDYLRWNGSTWSNPASLGAMTSIGAVSCPAATRCTLIDQDGYTRRWNGGSSWTPIVAFDLARGDLNTVTCVSSTFCLALDGGDNWLRFDGTKWTAPRSIAAHLRASELSCGSPTFCLLTDNSGDSLRFDGMTWRQTPRAPLQGYLSCTSAMYCAITGELVGEVPAWAVYSGGKWSAPMRLGGPTILDVGVSCVAPETCGLALNYGASAVMAVYRGTTRVAQSARVANYYDSAISCSGPSFCLMPSGQLSPGLEFVGTGFASTPALDDIGYTASCLSATFCEVVGNYGIYAWNGTSWNAPDPAVGINAGGFPSISCVRPTFCMGVGFNGASWTS